MSWFSDMFVGGDAQSSSDAESHYQEQQKALADKVAAREAAGTLTPQQADANGYNEILSASANDNLSTDQDKAAAQGLAEGAAEGFNNVLQAPGKVVGFAGDSLTKMAWGILKGIPWWVYLAGFAVLFVWMGGMTLLRGRLAKAPGPA